MADPSAEGISRAGSRLDRVGWTALGYAPFRWFLAAMLASTSANFVYYAALGWYVLEVTGSPAAVGFAFTAAGLPILFLTPHAGVLTDRLGARRGDQVVVTNDGRALQEMIGRDTPGRWSVLGLPDA